MSVCVHKLDPSGSKGSNAARMRLLSSDPGVDSNTWFLLKETRKKEACEHNSNPSTWDSTSAPAGA